MKKILGIVLTLLLVVGISMPSFAAKKSEKFDRIVAKIISIDATAKTIVVKEERSGASRTVKISAKAVSEIKVGDRVRIKLKPGTDESMGVRVLKDHTIEPATIEPTSAGTVAKK
ncbi:MAG: hypothetical protein HQL15_04130 [Candidatus Omnitrophica bacterium]|nr:hypothetical protein [Candidatus Omnitrophota bacterium]